MSLGQMIAQTLVGAPSVAATSVASTASSAPSSSQDAHAFEGVLCGVSSHATTKPVSGSVASKASQSDHSNEAGAEAAKTQQNDMASTQAKHDDGKEVKYASQSIDKTSSEQPEQSEQQKVGISQNVELAAALIQFASQQIDSSILKPASAAGAAEVGSLNPADSLNMAAITMQRNAVMDALEQQDASSNPAEPMQPASNCSDIAAANKQIAAMKVLSHRDSSELPPGLDVTAGNESSGNIMKELSVSSVNVVPEAVKTGDAVTVESVNTPAFLVSGQPGTETVKGVVRPTMDAYFQTSVAPQNDIATDTMPVAQPTGTLTPADGSTLNANSTLASRVQATAKTTDSQPVEENSSKQETVEAIKSPESSKKNVVALNKGMPSADGESSSQDGNGVTDHRMGTHDPALQMHQLKGESTSASTGAPTSTANEQNVMQQVVTKVGDHFAGREIKNGVEQVVIKLSPENLGELKLNLRMENQCLKVEIVAESSSVRDALIKHSTMLKDTLARQNIAMETFDVSTGSNGNGSTSYGKGDWRELAQQQRQQTAWNFSGGYRTDDLLAKTQSIIYRSPVKHSMVDVHF